MSLYLGENLISGLQSNIEPTRNIGQIIQSITPLSDAGLHLLDGSLIPGGGIYNAFVQYIAGLSSSYPQCFTDETTWQNTVINKGACGKFVYDSTNNTVRLPKITGFIEGTVDSGALGDLVNAGLPNITGTLSHSRLSYASAGFTGAFTGSEYPPFNYANNLSTNNDISITYNFDASRSNSIYGNSSTVQPQSIKVFYYIVLATTTKTDIEVDIDEVITDLNTIDSNAVHKIGNETVNGEKLFTSEIKRLATLSPSGNFLVKMYDNNGKGSSGIMSYYAGNGIYNRLISNNSTSNSDIWLDIISEDNGYGGIAIGGNNITINNLYPDSTSDLSVITQAWINGKFQVVSTLPASPDSRIFYFIPE